MKTFRINVKGFCKGTKENTYQIEASSYISAIGKALRKFKTEFKNNQYDEILIKVIM